MTAHHIRVSVPELATVGEFRWTGGDREERTGTQTLHSSTPESFPTAKGLFKVICSSQKQTETCSQHTAGGLGSHRLWNSLGDNGLSRSRGGQEPCKKWPLLRCPLALDPWCQLHMEGVFANCIPGWLSLCAEVAHWKTRRGLMPVRAMVSFLMKCGDQPDLFIFNGGSFTCLWRREAYP